MDPFLYILILLIAYWIWKAIFFGSSKSPKDSKVKPDWILKDEKEFNAREARIRKGQLGRKLTRYEKEMEKRQESYYEESTKKKKANTIKKRAATRTRKKKELQENEAQAGSGSGFLINNSGYVVTNYHVVGSNKKVKIIKHKKNYIGKVVAIDKVNDLALIKIAAQKNLHLKLASNDSDRLDNIITAGFPYGDSFSDHVKSTTGIVSALVGPGNNTSQLQISASIQPGNSGGPIIDGNNGSVVGVAVAKLDTEKFIEMYRSIPENVNFAIKSSTLKRFLKSNKIEFSSSDDSKLTNKEINDIIDSAVLFISC